MSQVAAHPGEEESSAPKELPGAPSPGSFSNRRQKNLQKFRRHLKERQTSDSSATGGAVLNVEGGNAEKSSFDNDPEQAVSEDGNQGDNCESIISSSTCTTSGAKVNNENVVDNDKDVKPLQDTNSVDNAAPKSPMPAGKPPQLATAGNLVEQQNNVSAMSPHTSKRRADIIKKFAKKNRQPHSESPRKEPSDEQHASKKQGDDAPPPRSASPPLMPPMTDSTNNNKANTTTNADATKQQDASPNKATKQVTQTDQTSENNENAVDEKITEAESADNNKGDETDGSNKHAEVSGEGETPPGDSDSWEDINNTTTQPECKDAESAKGEEETDDNLPNAGSNDNPNTETQSNEDGAAQDGPVSKLSEDNENTSTNEHDVSPTVESECNDKGESKPVDTHSCEASTSFDLRSIHEFPTKPIEEATARITKDPSWDAAKVIFSEYKKPASSRSPTSDAIDVFDTSDPRDWEANNNENSFSETFDGEIIANNAGGEGTAADRPVGNTDMASTPSQEPKESPASPRPETSTGQLQEPESPTSESSPRRKLSRLQVSNQINTFGFDISNLATDSTDALDDTKSKEEPDKESSYGDDDNLLVGNIGVDDESDESMWINESQPSKEERLQQYTADVAHVDDSSAASSSNEELNDESSRFSQDAPDIAYMAQTEEEREEEKKEAEDMHPRAEFDNMPPHIVNADAAPMFVLAAEAAVASAGPPQLYTNMAEPVHTMDSTAAPPSSGPVVEETKPGEVISAGPMESFSASNSADDSHNPDGRVQPDDDGVGYISKSSSSNSGDDSKTSSAGADGGDPTNGVGQGGDDDEPCDLEESTSLVGVSLVPSFGGSAKITAGSLPSVQVVKARDGMPPRGNLSPITLPPPPPPPLSKKKKKKKRKDNSTGTKDVPCIAPPPEEKLKKWLDSKQRAMPVGAPQQTIGDSSARPAPVTFPSQLQEEETSYETFAEKKEVWEEAAESPGSIHISCGGYSAGDIDMAWAAALPDQAKKGAEQLKCSDFAGEQWDTTPRLIGKSGENACVNGITDALAMAGLDVSSAKKALSCQDGGPTPSSVAPSPVDAARSIALENAMRRANQGVSRFDFNAAKSYLGVDTNTSLFESEPGGSASIGSVNSLEESKSGPSVKSKESNTVDEPPQLVRKDLNGALEHTNSERSEKVAFLETLMSPSMSMSPTNNGQNPGNDGDKGISLSPSSPIIHDTKMAEKVAIASHAAAVTFEEQYYAAKLVAQPTDESSQQEEDKNDLQSLSMFCSQEIGENLQKMGGEEAAKLFFGQDSGQTSKDDFAGIIGEKAGVLRDFMLNSPSRDDHNNVQDLAGGAFSPWKNGVYARKPSPTESADRPGSVTIPAASSSSLSERSSELLQTHRWLTQVLHCGNQEMLEDSAAAADAVRDSMTRLLHVDDNFNTLCITLADTVNIKIDRENEERTKRNAPLSPRKKIKPFVLGPVSGQKSSAVVAANFVSFIHRTSKISGEPNPFGEDNPFLLDLVGTSIHGTPIGADPTKMQKIVFRQCAVEDIVAFCARVCGGPDSAAAAEAVNTNTEVPGGSSFDLIEATRAANPSPTKKSKNNFFDDRCPSSESGLSGERKWIVPDEHPSPFETMVEHEPKILAVILGFLGDPVAVCRLKMTHKKCQQFVRKNEQVLMRDAVRLGGLSMHVRPSFWLWVILEKCHEETKNDVIGDNKDQLLSIEEAGRAGKYHSVIQRDVARAFGNMPPHKTGSRLRTDSIVRALVSWGRNRIMKRGVKGDTPPTSGRMAYDSDSQSEASQTRAETVSDWGGVSPVASFAGSCNGEERGTKADEGKKRSEDSQSQSVSTDLLVLGGTALTDAMKSDLQNKLSFILHALAATHMDVGYCQGMDYVVAHLLRILQETICWRATNGSLPACIVSAPKLEAKSASELTEETDNTLVVEETIYRVMDCLFTTFNLQHMYWPELRCLKTCCRVFERLIQIKLPVLADHFEHHELNVGLFALGWFQTLFLYLPSMPTATVCHIWDIWLVERSFKIFFRVGTAILFLSQPILLNHELEGMMTYLNTFPDATLLNPDILIACALQIKVTNKLLQDIEEQVMSR